MPGTDPNHWLYRLSPDEWLSAATSELARAVAALEGKQHRAGVTQALRSAGMAWNAVLAATVDETSYGRSYREHLDVLARDRTVPESVRLAAEAIVTAPLTQQVVALGRGDTSLAKHAHVILEHARERITPSATS